MAVVADDDHEQQVKQPEKKKPESEDDKRSNCCFIKNWSSSLYSLIYENNSFCELLIISFQEQETEDD